MKPGPNGKGRPRGRSNHSQPQSYGKGRGPSRNHVYDSNGPGIRVRGNAHQVVEKYQALARDAATTGDRILYENFCQHAEHYQRIISAMAQNMPQRSVVSIERGSENGSENHSEEPLASEAVVEPLGESVASFSGSSVPLGGSVESANGFSGSAADTGDARSLEEDTSRRRTYESRAQQVSSERTPSRRGIRNGHAARHPVPSDVSLPDAPQPFIVAPEPLAEGVPSAEPTPRMSSPEPGGSQTTSPDAEKSVGDGTKKVRRRRVSRHSGDTPEESPTESVDV